MAKIFRCIIRTGNSSEMPHSDCLVQSDKTKSIISKSQQKILSDLYQQQINLYCKCLSYLGHLIQRNQIKPTEEEKLKYLSKEEQTLPPVQQGKIIAGILHLESLKICPLRESLINLLILIGNNDITLTNMEKQAYLTKEEQKLPYEQQKILIIAKLYRQFIQIDKDSCAMNNLASMMINGEITPTVSERLEYLTVEQQKLQLRQQMLFVAEALYRLAIQIDNYSPAVTNL